MKTIVYIITGIALAFVGATMFLHVRGCMNPGVAPLEPVPDTVYVDRAFPEKVAASTPDVVTIYKAVRDTVILRDTVLVVPRSMDSSSLRIATASPLSIQGRKAVLTLWDPGESRYEEHTYVVKPPRFTALASFEAAPHINMVGLDLSFQHQTPRVLLSFDAGPRYNLIDGTFGVGFRVTARLPIRY